MQFDVNYDKLTVMGVSFPTRELLDLVVSAINSNVIEGYRPDFNSVKNIKVRLVKKGIVNA